MPDPRPNSPLPPDTFKVRERPLFPKEPSVSPEPALPVPDADGTKRTTEPPPGMMRFNTGKHRMTLIPASFGRYTAAVLEYGAIKYDTNNWRQGGSWTSAIDSLQRHLDAFREGEDCDPESTLPHLAHLAFNVMILIEFFDKNLGQDDRFRYPEQPHGEQIPGRELTFKQPPRKS